MACLWRSKDNSPELVCFFYYVTFRGPTQVVWLAGKHLYPEPSFPLFFLFSKNGVSPVCMSVYHLSAMPAAARKGLRIPPELEL